MIKINGSPKEGVWFERDVTLLSVVSDATDFQVADFGVDGPVELVVRALQTRGTIIGMSREDDNTLHVIYGHAAGNLAGADDKGLNALTELKALLDAIPGLGTFTLTVGTTFVVA